MFEPVAVLTAIQEHQVTDILLVPTMIQLLVDHPRVGEFDLTEPRGGSPTAPPRSRRACSAGR